MITRTALVFASLFLAMINQASAQTPSPATPVPLGAQPLNTVKPAAPAITPSSPSGTKLPPVSLGIVDLQVISRDSLAAKSVRDQVEKQWGTYAADFQKRQNDLRNAVQDLQRQRGTLSADAFQDRRAALETQDGELQREVEKRRREMDEVVSENLRQMENAVIEVVDQIRQERGLNLILHRASAIYTGPELELTAEVLQRLDRKLPRLTVKFPTSKR